MGSSLAELQRIGCKVYFAAAAPLELEAVVPVFHRWIQTGAVAGMLIDVADYAHVEQGPGVLLVAHEGNYAVDLSGGRPGMLYYSKHASPGDLAARLRRVCALALRAASLLEREPGLNGAARCAGDELQLFANDRLRAPNDAASAQALRPEVDALLGALYPGMTCAVTGNGDPRQRLAVDIKAAQPVPLATLLQRLGG